MCCSHRRHAGCDRRLARARFVPVGAEITTTTTNNNNNSDVNNDDNHNTIISNNK